MKRIERPKEAKYGPYAIQYIGLHPDDRLVLEHLQKNLEATRALLLSQPEDKLLYREELLSATFTITHQAAPLLHASLLSRIPR